MNQSKYNKNEVRQYEPPGYMASVSENNGLYDPGFMPENKPAPHFQRPPIQHKDFMRDYRLHSVKILEVLNGYMDPWMPIYKDMHRKF
jgi:hypothetical protein